MTEISKKNVKILKKMASKLSQIIRIIVRVRRQPYLFWDIPPCVLYMYLYVFIYICIIYIQYSSFSQIDQPTLMLSSRDYYTRNDTSRIYWTAMRDLLVALNASSEQSAETDALEMLRFETALANVSLSRERAAEKSSDRGAVVLFFTVHKSVVIYSPCLDICAVRTRLRT